MKSSQSISSSGARATFFVEVWRWGQELEYVPFSMTLEENEHRGREK